MTVTGEREIPDVRYAQVGDVRLAYETFGDPGGVPVLMIMGLGTQMIAWPDPVCAALADRGHYVIRYDNRDVGLSTHLREVAPPSPLRVLLRLHRAPYTVGDMARDAVGLLAALELDSAHLVGASMGGFIAQTLAVRRPELVRSLTLIMTSTGGRLVGYPSAAVAAALLRRRHVGSRAEAVELAVQTFRRIGSRGYPLDEDRLRDVAGRSYDRAHDAGGFLRQLAAVTAQSDRTRRLGRVRVPTAVLHGLADPLVHVSGGLAVARAIPGARFVGYPGMGHDLPRELWPAFVEEISAVVARGERQRRSSTVPHA